MLSAGLKMHPRELTKGSGSSLGIALGGMLIPMSAGIFLGWLVLPDSDFKLPETMFNGAAMAISAVPVAVKVLMNLNRSNSPFGQSIVLATVFDDLLGLILLAVLTALLDTGAWPGLAAFSLIWLRLAQSS